MASEEFDQLPDGSQIDEANLAGYFRDYYPGALSGQQLIDAIANSLPGALIYDLDSDSVCTKSASGVTKSVPSVEGTLSRYKVILPTGQNVGGGTLDAEKTIVFTGSTVTAIQGTVPTVSASGVEIPTDAAGWWEVEARLNYINLDISSTATRFSDLLRITVNGTSVSDGLGATSYLRDTSNHEQSSNSAKTWVNLSAADVVGISSARVSGSSGAVDLEPGCQLLMTKLT